LASIAVTPSTASIAKLTTQQFAATGTYNDGSVFDITAQATWTSTNTAIATVASGGLATAAAPGTTSIRATFSGVTGSASLTVTNATLVSIAVSPTSATIPKGYKQQYTATGTFNDGTVQNITNLVAWTSSNTGVATISNASGSNGLATVSGPGTVTIKAQLGTVSGTATLIGTNAVLQSITVSPSSATVAVKATQQLTATGHFSDGSSLVITTQVAWVSSKKKLASVRYGLVTGVATGTATITAKHAGVSGTATITVP
jgi:hypothetical protein